MHPKMMTRNKKVFQSKRKDPSKSIPWARAHVQARFTDEEKEELLGRSLRKKLT